MAPEPTPTPTPVEPPNAAFEGILLDPETSAIVAHNLAQDSLKRMRRVVYFLMALLVVLVAVGIITIIVQSHDNSAAIHASAHASYLRSQA